MIQQAIAKNKQNICDEGISKNKLIECYFLISVSPQMMTNHMIQCLRILIWFTVSSLVGYFCRNQFQVKALVNEDTLLRTHCCPWCCLGCANWETIVADTKFVSATNVARAGKQGNICVGNIVSATMCPRLPGPLSLLQCSNVTNFLQRHILRDVFGRH